MAFLIERPIPERPYFKVGDVAHILGVVPSTVRYWQKEFPDHIHPETSMSGQNVFSRNDVILMAVILNLVRIDGISLKDARAALDSIIREHGGKVDSIMLCRQSELELALSPDETETESPRDRVVEFGPALTSTSPASEILADGGLQAAGSEVAALEDENTELRRQLSLRMQEIDDLRCEIAAMDAARDSLRTRLTTIVDEMLTGLDTRTE